MAAVILFPDPSMVLTGTRMGCYHTAQGGATTKMFSVLLVELAKLVNCNSTSRGKKAAY